MKFVAQTSTVWMKWFQLWMLVNLTEKEGNFQNIQVLEEKNKKRNNFIQLKMKVTKACPIWQPKNIFETLKRVLRILPCKVLLVNTVLLPHTELKNLMSIIADEEVLFYVENVSEKITFYEKFESQNKLKATDRPCEVCCQTIRDCTVAHSLVWVSWIFGKKKISCRGFYYRLKCENLLGKLITANFVIYFDFFLFELPRRVRPAHDNESRQSAEVLLAYGGKRKLNPKSNFSKIFFISNIWLMLKLWVWIFD